MTTKSAASITEQPKRRATKTIKRSELTLIPSNETSADLSSGPREETTRASWSVLGAQVKSQPSVHISEAKIAVDPAEQDELQSLALPTGIHLVPVTQTVNEVLAFGERLETRPARVLGFLAISETAAARLSAVRRVWGSRFNETPPELAEFSTPLDPLGILRWVATRLLAVQEETSRRNVALMRDLTAIRTAHDHTQEAFRRLEALAATMAALIRTESFAIEPQPYQARLKPSETLVQMIPTSSVGVSDIAVHIARTVPGAAPKLQVRLRLREDDSVVARWSVEPQSVPATGWVQLGLPESLGVDEQTLCAEIENEGAEEIWLSLGVPHPESRWCAYSSSHVADRTLAIKLWRALPRTRAPMLPASLAPGQPRTSWLVATEALRSAVAVNGPAEGVHYVEDNRGVLVHPVDQNPTIARLAGACPANATHIAAVVETRHPQAGVVEYALGVMSPKSKKKGPPTFDAGFSTEWLPLSAMKRTELHLFLPRPLDAAADVFLMTRIAPQASNAFCWATFWNLSAHSS